MIYKKSQSESLESLSHPDITQLFQSTEEEIIHHDSISQLPSLEGRGKRTSLTRSSALKRTCTLERIDTNQTPPVWRQIIYVMHHLRFFLKKINYFVHDNGWNCMKSWCMTNKSKRITWLLSKWTQRFWLLKNRTTTLNSEEMMLIKFSAAVSTHSVCGRTFCWTRSGCISTTWVFFFPSLLCISAAKRSKMLDVKVKISAV